MLHIRIQWFTNAGKYATILSYEKLWEKESTFAYRITEKSLRKEFPELRGDVQEQVEDGFGEAVPTH